VLELQEKLIKEGYLIGAIRPPTVKEPILRVILRVNQKEHLMPLLELIKKSLQ
jgi:8-amino-7-oxononanoate synthase